jgi:amphi-Trp domain-containing protein
MVRARAQRWCTYGCPLGHRARELVDRNIDRRLVRLLELKEKTTPSREEAAARLHAMADEPASGNDFVVERDGLRFVAPVADRMELKVELEVEDDGTELEIERSW